MNYRHDYHAGNFADVFKHIILTRIISYLKTKQKAFRVIDTHAGSGRYQLPPANQLHANGTSPEWVNGIGKLIDWKPSPDIESFVQPYLDSCFKDLKADKRLRYYPGSPLIAFQAMRKQDRLSAIELHKEAFEHLKLLFEGNFQARILNLDGWLIPGSQIPPKEKRGVMMIDPPFELAGEFERLEWSVHEAAKRWSGGTVALWYPLKYADQTDHFKENLKTYEISNLQCFEIEIDRSSENPKLYGCGMIIRNAPYVLEAEMNLILPELLPFLETSKGSGKWRISRLTAE